MLPIKSNLNQNNHFNNNNNKNKNNQIRPSPPFNNKKTKRKNNMNDSKIKLPHLYREKSDKIIYSKVNINKINGIHNSSFKKNQDISMPNIINNSFNNYKLNEKNIKIEIKFKFRFV